MTIGGAITFALRSTRLRTSCMVLLSCASWRMLPVQKVETLTSFQTW